MKAAHTNELAVIRKQIDEKQEILRLEQREDRVSDEDQEIDV